MTLPPPSSIVSSPVIDPAIVAPPPQVPVAPPPPPAPVRFPLDWLLRHAAPAIQYRSLTEVARMAPGDAEKVAGLPFAHRPAIQLALRQSADGSWEGGMLGIPSSRAEHFEGVGTIPAVRRLMEYGWHKESPPLMHARRDRKSVV